MTTISPLFSQLTSTPRGGSTPTTDLATDFTNFLNLLTTQLQNQDPLEPLDTNQFTEQLVQMTEVEQTVSMNERLGALIDAQETQRIQTAADFVGKQVDALGDIVPLTEIGAEMFYALPADASLVNAKVVRVKPDGTDGEVVGRIDNQLPREAGVHRFLWDGRDLNEEFVDVNDTYRFSVTAKSADGQAMNIKIGFSGVVEELRQEDGALNLLVAGEKVALEEIVATRVPTFVSKSE